MRVVAATNRDLEAEVEAGRFREDLFYRLNVHQIAVPPLRERRSDVPEIAERFAAAICERFGMRRKRLAADALDLLMGYDWRRNNVRELRNVVERMIIATDGEVIGPEQVPAEIQGEARGSSEGGGTFAALKAEAERRIVITALERNEWHVTRTAEALGLCRSCEPPQDHAEAQHQAAVGRLRSGQAWADGMTRPPTLFSDLSGRGGGRTTAHERDPTPRSTTSTSTGRIRSSSTDAGHRARRWAGC